MKRKFKLFATVASLCLSVALMAFGVYAASTVNYSVSSTVSFDSVQVATTWAAHAYKGDGTTEWGTAGAYTIDDEDQTTGNNTWNQPIVFTTTENENVVIYDITCTNDGSAPIDIAVTGSGLTASAQLSVVIQEGLNDEEESVTTLAELAGYEGLTKGATYSVIITVTLNDFSQALTAQTLSLSFTATPAA